MNVIYQLIACVALFAVAVLIGWDGLARMAVFVAMLALVWGLIKGLVHTARRARGYSAGTPQTPQRRKGYSLGD